MDYVLGFVFSEDDNVVLLQRKARPEWQCGKYNGIGGKVEADETPNQAMRRESQEEVGNPLQWNSIGTLRHNGHIIYVYKATASNEILNNLISFSRRTDEPCMVFNPKSLPPNPLADIESLVALSRCANLKYFFLETT